MLSIPNSITIDLSPASACFRKSPNDDGAADTSVTIQCLSELTPIDMMDMSFGIADPTGSVVWLGSFLFMEMFSRDLETNLTETQKSWSQLRSTVFPPNCHAVELGAGTGMSGLSLMVMSTRDCRTKPSIYTGPSLLVQTDANDDALELCRINRDLNIANNGNECIYVEKLQWGKGNAAKVMGSQEENPEGQQFPSQNVKASPTKSFPTSYDVVFASDVLYDLASLGPLVTTASELLKEGGYFVLSHVPRASIDSDGDDSTSGEVDVWHQLESIIIREASKEQLFLASFPSIFDDMHRGVIEAIMPTNGVFRPSLLSNIWKDSSSLSKKHSWQKMVDVGAAILIFQKKGL